MIPCRRAVEEHQVSTHIAYSSLCDEKTCASGRVRAIDHSIRKDA